MRTIRTFNEKDTKDICNLYEKEGYTMTFLSKKYHCRLEAIKNILVSNNVKIKKKGLSKNRSTNEDFFEKIDSEEKAYFLGLMFSDGYVVNNKKRSPTVGISLKIDDIDILEKFRTLLNIHSEIGYDKRKGKECAVLRIRNQKLAADLSKYGIVQNKTYITKNLPEVPKEFEIHFLRGLLDGDGSIYKINNSTYIDFCSYHENICKQFQKIANTYLSEENKNRNVVANYGTAYHIRFYKKDAVKQLATALYKDSKFYLARKYALAEELFIEDKSEEDIVYSDSEKEC